MSTILGSRILDHPLRVQLHLEAKFITLKESNQTHLN